MKGLGRNKIFHHESQAGCIVWVWDAWVLDLASSRTHKGKIVKKITEYIVWGSLKWVNFPKCSYLLTYYHTNPKIWTSSFLCFLLCLKMGGWVAYRVDLDQNLYSLTYDLSLHCLLWPICLNADGKYDRYQTEITSILHLNPCHAE